MVGFDRGLEVGAQFEASLGDRGQILAQRTPLLTTLGTLGGHSAQYLAHVGYSAVLRR